VDFPQYRLAIVEDVRLYVTSFYLEGVVCALPRFIAELKLILYGKESIDTDRL